jgi:hypothetical protein
MIGGLLRDPLEHEASIESELTKMYQNMLLQNLTPECLSSWYFY